MFIVCHTISLGDIMIIKLHIKLNYLHTLIIYIRKIYGMILVRVGKKYESMF